MLNKIIQRWSAKANRQHLLTLFFPIQHENASEALKRYVELTPLTHRMTYFPTAKSITQTVEAMPLPDEVKNSELSDMSNKKVDICRFARQAIAFSHAANLVEGIPLNTLAPKWNDIGSHYLNSFINSFIPSNNSFILNNWELNSLAASYHVSSDSRTAFSTCINYAAQDLEAIDAMLEKKFKEAAELKEKADKLEFKDHVSDCFDNAGAAAKEAPAIKNAEREQKATNVEFKLKEDERNEQPAAGRGGR